MTVTASYSLTHYAYAQAAREHDVEPFVARVAYALYERGGSATTHELTGDLSCESSHVRRALGRMYRSGLALGEAWSGGPRQRGLVTLVRLTSGGERLVRSVRTHLQGLSEPTERAA